MTPWLIALTILAAPTTWLAWCELRPNPGTRAAPRWQQARARAADLWLRWQWRPLFDSDLEPLPAADARTVQWVHDLGQPPARWWPPATWAAMTIGARWLTRAAEVRADGTWADDTHAFSRSLLNDMLRGAA